MSTPMPVLQQQFPQSLGDLRLWFYFFSPPPSHSSVTLMHLGMFHAVADDFWFEGGSARMDGDWSSAAEWRSITQIISGAGNVSTQAERGSGGGGVTWPWAVNCVWHLVSQPRQGLIIFISPPLTVGTVVHSVSEKKKSNTMNSVVFSGASVRIYMFTLNAHFLSLCNFSSRRDRKPTYALAINLAQSR